MLPMMLLAAAMAMQDPKPAPKTVEERLKELDGKLEALEKKQKTLADENAAMEKQIADRKAMRENLARQIGASWVQRYAAPIGLNATETAELQALWIAWSREDMEQPGDAARWTTREATLKGKLTADQATLLAKRVHEEQVQNVKSTVSAYVRMCQIGAERAAPFEKAVLGKVTIADDILVPQAHAVKTWEQTVDALRAGLSELKDVLTDQERTRLQNALEGTRVKGK